MCPHVWLEAACMCFIYALYALLFTPVKDFAARTVCGGEMGISFQFPVHFVFSYRKQNVNDFLTCVPSDP